MRITPSEYSTRLLDSKPDFKISSGRPMCLPERLPGIIIRVVSIRLSVFILDTTTLEQITRLWDSFRVRIIRRGITIPLWDMVPVKIIPTEPQTPLWVYKQVLITRLTLMCSSGRFQGSIILEGLITRSSVPVREVIVWVMRVYLSVFLRVDTIPEVIPTPLWDTRAAV